MKRQKNENEYDHQEIKLFTTVLILFGVIVMMVCSIFAYITSNIRTKQETYYTSSLYTVTKPCELKITIDYDVEPIDVILHDPTGAKYNAYHLHQYEDTGESIVLSVITDCLGDWRIEYNQKRNQQIHTQIEALPAEQLFLTDVELLIDTDTIWISFYPLYGDGTDTSKEFKCFALMNNKFAKKSIMIYDGILSINEPITIQCNTDYLVTSNDWDLRLITYQTNVDNPESFRACYQQSNITFTKNETIQ